MRVLLIVCNVFTTAKGLLCFLFLLALFGFCCGNEEIRHRIDLGHCKHTQNDFCFVFHAACRRIICCVISVRPVASQAVSFTFVFYLILFCKVINFYRHTKYSHSRVATTKTKPQLFADLPQGVSRISQVA